MKNTIFSVFGNFKTNTILMDVSLKQMSTKISSLDIPNVKIAVVWFGFQQINDLHLPFFHIAGYYENKKRLASTIKSQDQFNHFIGKQIKNAIQNTYSLDFHIGKMSSYAFDCEDATFQQGVKIYPQ